MLFERLSTPKRRAAPNKWADFDQAAGQSGSFAHPQRAGDASGTVAVQHKAMEVALTSETTARALTALHCTMRATMDHFISSLGALGT